MTPEEIEEFKAMNGHNAKLYEYMHRPELL
jgi:hypothetical protein